MSNQENTSAEPETCESAGIKCPACGAWNYDAWELHQGEFEWTDNEYKCHECGARLIVQKQVSIDYVACVWEPDR